MSADNELEIEQALARADLAARAGEYLECLALAQLAQAKMMYHDGMHGRRGDGR